MSTDIMSNVLFFFCTAFLGWCMEVTCKYIQFRRFINRGFLIGPYCPVYGFGSLLVTLCLQRYSSDPFAVFGLAILLCGILQYTTSYVMEKLFHARWWDYSSKSFNLNGRICANTLIPFGLLGLALVYVVKPFFFGLYAQMSVQLLTAVDAVLCTGFTADTAISATILVHIRGKAGQAEGDSTEAITAAVRAELSREGILMRRAINAFPHLRLSNKRLHDKLKQERARLKAEVRAREEKLRTEFNERDARLREELRRRKDELKQHRKS